MGVSSYQLYDLMKSMTEMTIMPTTFLLITLLCVLSPPVACKSVKLKHIHNMLHKIEDMLQASPVSSTSASPLSASVVEQVLQKVTSAVAIPEPAMLRLSFHACVGGCDGCVNVNDPNNAVLADLVSDLEEVYQSQGLADIISRADLWALLGIWAVEKTIARNNQECNDCETVPALQTEFQWGREDCKTAPYTDALLNFPSTLWNHSRLMDYFASDFGLTEREVTAMMGSHTIGRAEHFNSNSYKIKQGYFNNKYYSHLNDQSLDWKLDIIDCVDLNNINTSLCEEGLEKSWKWTVQDTQFNLNPDVALVKSFEIDDEGQPSCQFHDCPDSSSASIVEEFAQSNAKFIEDFSAAYKKLLSNGYVSLNSLE